MPKSFAEKLKFKETIKSLMRIPNGMNFEEAQNSYVEAFKTNNLEFGL